MKRQRLEKTRVADIDLEIVARMSLRDSLVGTVRVDEITVSEDENGGVNVELRNRGNVLISVTL